MARRYIAEEPTSQLAVWARRIALFSLVAVIFSIVIVRSGLLEIRPALVTFFGALALAALALPTAVGAFAVIWRDGLNGMGSALAALAISVGLLAYPTYLGIRSYGLPWIYDITTDPIDPPRYLSNARPREANPIIYAGLTAAEQQRAAYPDIEPLEADVNPQLAYKAALDVITKRKWRLVLARPPDARRPDGQIEAVARTPVMGFSDDVVVRVRGDGDSSRVDVRSSSRYGQFDFGSNATRVRALVEDIDDAIGRQKPDPVPVATPTPPPAPAKKGSNRKDTPTARR